MWTVTEHFDFILDFCKNDLLCLNCDMYSYYRNPATTPEFNSKLSERCIDGLDATCANDNNNYNTLEDWIAGGLNNLWVSKPFCLDIDNINMLVSKPFYIVLYTNIILLFYCSIGYTLWLRTTVT